ncbi:hypothetical protein MKEN_00641400 [Mycena kentingensis (nom. inval.)]|nr:hypothetical protein MKEN_00641400 [Mycena kentingensis (nom. inval.)]
MARIHKQKPTSRSRCGRTSSSDSSYRLSYFSLPNFSAPSKERLRRAAQDALQCGDSLYEVERTMRRAVRREILGLRPPATRVRILDQLEWLVSEDSGYSADVESEQPHRGPPRIDYSGHGGIDGADSERSSDDEKDNSRPNACFKYLSETEDDFYAEWHATTLEMSSTEISSTLSPHPIQSELSIVIDACNSDILRAFKATGVLNRDNAEVIGGAVHFRVSDVNVAHHASGALIGVQMGAKIDCVVDEEPKEDKE